MRIITFILGILSLGFKPFSTEVIVLGIDEEYIVTSNNTIEFYSNVSYKEKAYLVTVDYSDLYEDSDLEFPEVLKTGAIIKVDGWNAKITRLRRIR